MQEITPNQYPTPAGAPAPGRISRLPGAGYIIRPTEAQLMSQALAVGQGFNVFGELDLSSLMQPLFDYNAAGTVPFTFLGKSYLVPSFIAAVQDTSSYYTGGTFLSRESFQNDFAAHAGVSGSYGAFSGELEADYSRQFKQNTQYAFAYRRFYSELAYLELSGGSQYLSTEFKAAVANLPDHVTDANILDFFSFFETWGVYFTQRVVLGGACSFYAAVSTASQLTSQEISAMFDAQYDGVFKSGSINADVTNTQTWQAYTRNGSFSVVGKGGDPVHVARIGNIDPLRPSGDTVAAFVDWVASLSTDPAIVDFQLAGIWQQCGAKSAVVQEAWEVYGTVMHPHLTIQTSAASLDYPPPPAQPPLVVLGEQVAPQAPPDNPVGYQLIVIDSRNLVDTDGIATGILLDKYYTVPQQADWGAPDPEFPGYALWQRPYNQMLRDIVANKLINGTNILILAGFNLDHRMAPTSGMESLLLNAGAGAALLDWCGNPGIRGVEGTQGGWGTDQQVPGTGMSASPSALMFNGNLYCLHQGGGNSGQLWCNVFDGATWRGDQQIPNVGMSASPSTVLYGGRLLCFHQGYGNNGQLWNLSFDGNNWSGDGQVPGTGMSESPSAVVFDDQLYCFHQGSGNNGQLWYNVFNGNNWLGDRQVPGTSISASPSAVVYNGKLYCFHQGGGNNGQLWVNAFDGNTWSGDQQIPNVGMSAGPSAVVMGTTLTCFHQGGGNNGQLWAVSFDGSRWGADQQAPNAGMSESPSATAFNGKIFCFHQGSGENGQLWYDVQSSGAWIENGTAYVLVGTFGQGQLTGFELLKVAPAGTQAALAASIYFYRQVYGGQYTLGVG